jgi:hypothetical protein
MEIEPELVDIDKRAKEYMREWGFDAEKFEARAKESLGAAKGDLSEVTGALRQSMTRTKQVLLDLEKSRGPVVSELKTGFERGWSAIEEAFMRARQRMRESSMEKAGAGRKADEDPDWWS